MIWRLFFLVILLTSCGKEKGVDITIKNNRSYPIYNVEIYTSEQTNVLKFDQIDEEKEVAGFLSMSKAKSDGHYIIQFDTGSFIINGETKRKVEKTQSGYYTNGSPIDKNHIIIINKDTIKWHTQLKNY